MKNLSVLFILVVLLVFNSCTQKKDAKTILENPETRSELYNEIVNDHKLLTEFMTTMRANNHAMIMMREDRGMMNNFMQGNGMGRMMRNKPMRQNMMGMMVKDTTIMKEMMEMMHQKEVMNQDNMQFCMKMMRERKMMSN